MIIELIFIVVLNIMNIICIKNANSVMNPGLPT